VVQALVDLAVELTGRLDVMVNNAGVGYLGAVMDGTVEQWRAMLETNVLALLVGCQAAIRAMRRLGTPGCIVNISSVAATTPTSGVYGATKHAVNVITDTLRTELLDDPIRVTTIMPGVVATNLARTLPEETLRTIAALAGVDAEVIPGARIPDEVLERAQVALHEFIATPDDVADAVLYAVTRPADLHVTELVVRPKKDLAL
jgi:NADP-dependent 3-hydroxy acid dehydrogenase YdfG